MFVVSMVLHLVAVVASLCLPAWLLQGSAALAGSGVPSFGKAFITSFGAAFVVAWCGAVYSVTGGLVIYFFLGVGVAQIGGLVVAWVATTMSFSGLLRIGVLEAGKVAVVYHVAAAIIGGTLVSIGWPIFS